MKNKTKSEMTNFEVKVKEILNELGAIHLESLYTINTKYGKLNIKIDIDKSPIYSIFCKFEEKEKFDEYKNIRLNPYSGKYNFHNSDLNSILIGFKNELNTIIIK